MTRWLPRSLAGRLRAASLVTIAAALILAGSFIYTLLHRFVTGQIDQRLDAQISLLATSLEQNPGSMGLLRQSFSDRPFDRQESGWTWQVQAPGGSVASLSTPPGLELPSRALRPDTRDLRPAPADGFLPHGLSVHWRIQTLPIEGQPVTIGASAPAHAIATPLRQAFIPLAVALVTLGLLLYLAALIQVRIGLKPLASLRENIAAIRSGDGTAMSAQQPTEIQPLVDEINNLLADNFAGLERTRRHAANLAHGLKTPLASMSMSLENPTIAQLGALRADVERMDRLIRHHLSRSRAATLGGAARASTDIVQHLADLAALMRGIHRERSLLIDISAGKELSAAVEAQDFDEIAGNLMDNACKWAQTKVSVHAQRVASRLRIDFVDDGPGIAADDLPEVLRPGRRLDESTPGYGFGLAITRELVELYGGSIALNQAAGGGLRVEIELPAA